MAHAGAGDPILVIGAGIGGLTLANGLLRADQPVCLLEREPVLRPIGAGITVQINGLRALEQIGLASPVRAAGMEMAAGQIRAADGRVLTALPIARLAAATGQPMLGIHRGRLQQVLLDALPADCLQAGAGLRSYRLEADGVVAELSNGETRRGRALVGCDGLHSTVRSQLLGAAEPDYAGYTTWRGVARGRGLLDGDISAEIWGRGLRFGCIPIGADEVYWFAVRNAPAGGSDPPGESLATVRAAFAGFAPPVGPLLDATGEADVLRTDVHDRPAAPRWGEGPVTLLGDAAHPMTPNLGQGGCQAIEDAVSLAGWLSREADTEAALRHYERRRQPRTRWFVEQSRRAGRMGQLEGRVACALRDAAIRLLPDRLAEGPLRRRFVPEL